MKVDRCIRTSHWHPFALQRILLKHHIGIGTCDIPHQQIHILRQHKYRSLLCFHGTGNLILHSPPLHLNSIHSNTHPALQLTPIDRCSCISLHSPPLYNPSWSHPRIRHSSRGSSCSSQFCLCRTCIVGIQWFHNLAHLCGSGHMVGIQLVIQWCQ